MKISIQLSADDYIQARRLGMRPRAVLRYIGWPVLVLFLAFIAWQGYEALTGSGFQTDFWVPVGLAFYFAALYFIVIPWRTRRLFAQQKTLQAPAELEFTDTHFTGTSTHGTFKMAWGDFHKWKKNQRMILVYQSAALMHMIPLRAFQSEADIHKLESILEKHFGPQKA